MFMSTNDGGLQESMLTVKEVAHLLHVHPSTVRRWEKQGQLKSYRVGPKGSIRFKREDLNTFLGLGNKLRDKKGHQNFSESNSSLGRKEKEE